jgi:hypothetical protein
MGKLAQCSDLQPMLRSVAIVTVERGQVLDATGPYEVFDHPRWR